jgi:hypothetical protein
MAGRCSPFEPDSDLGAVRAGGRGDLVGDRSHKLQAVSFPQRPGARRGAIVADLAAQHAGRCSYQQPSCPCAVRYHVRSQLMHGEEHVNRQAFGHAHGGRAGCDSFSQEVERGGVEALVDHDHFCF